MPSVKERTSSFNRRMAKEFPGVFRVDDLVLFCLMCVYQISSIHKSQFKQHLSSAHQIKCSKLKNKESKQANQTLLTTLNKTTDRNRHASEFAMDLTMAFLKTNIPQQTVCNPVMVEFLEKHTK